MAKRVYVPTSGPTSWKQLLAQPDLHWKEGHSAMCVAQAWEHHGDCLPPEVSRALSDSGLVVFKDLDLLLAIPEYQVALPGGSRSSQTDVFALAGNDAGLVAIAVEGKVDEPFGPTVGVKRAEGAEERLAYLHSLLELDAAATEEVRYQLLHRTAAALRLAERFHAAHAAMVVHSFSKTSRWRSDFDAFAAALGARQVGDHTYDVGQRGAAKLILAWAAGEERFRKASPIPPAQV